MASNLETARAYYEAAERRDGAALFEILHHAVELRLTEGLPDGLGGAYEDREAALGVLRRAAEGFDPLACPKRFLLAQDGHVVVLGRYAGVARETGRPFDAAFVHVLRVRDGRIDRFTQVTDSRRWADARAALAPGRR